MDPEATWAILTDVNSTPAQRRDAALNLLAWEANRVCHIPGRVAACEAVIIAEFEYADRLAGR